MRNVKGKKIIMARKNIYSKKKRTPLQKAFLVIGIVFCVFAVLLSAAYGVFLHYYGKMHIGEPDDPSVWLEEGDLELKEEEIETENSAEEDIQALEEALKHKNESGLDFGDEDVYNLLLLGTDGRSKSERGRSDSMIILSINRRTKKLTLTSLMRDMYMDIPGLSQGNRLNAAYSTGGTERLFATIEQNFKITPAQLEAAITPKTRALILCSPSNPTGSVYSAEEMEGLAAVLRKYPDVIVIADEIYEHINYVGKHASIATCEGMKERTAIINGVSKAYAMTGWRIGFVAAPLELAKAVNKLQGQYTSGPCSVSQIAATVAFAADQTPVETMRQAFERRKNLIVKLAKEIPGFEVNDPDGAFYLFPKCSSFFGKTDGERVINDSMDFALYLLEVGHVATVGGAAFGSPECFRMSYATSDENIIEALKRIKETLARLK